MDTPPSPSCGLTLFLGSDATDKLATLLSIPVFWLRFLDAVTRRRSDIDGASGTFFFGVKSDRTLSAREMGRYYEQQATAQLSGPGQPCNLPAPATGFAEAAAAPGPHRLEA